MRHLRRAHALVERALAQSLVVGQHDEQCIALGAERAQLRQHSADGIVQPERVRSVVLLPPAPGSEGRVVVSMAGGHVGLQARRKRLQREASHRQWS